MKVLQIHKFHTKQRGGGSVTSYFETTKFLKNSGHEVIFFSMHDSRNEKTEYEKYFVEGFDLSKKMSFWEKLKLLPKTIYNREAVRKIEKLVIAQRPDIAHAHNIEHYLTPAIFKVLKKHNIPIVMTLHNYHLICPNYKLFVRGKICERCKKTKYYNCFLNKCVKDSYAMSLVAMIDAYFNKLMRSYSYVDLFIAPSHFMRNKCIEFGIDSKKIMMVRNNFTPTESSDLFQEKDYFLYFGRLSDEKGINQLIDAVKTLKNEDELYGKKLCIVGKGPEEESLKSQVQKNNLDKEIEFLGFKTGNDLEQIIAESMFVVAPSIWYENAPFVAVEAHTAKRPIIVSDLGGTRELIEEGASGLVYEANNIIDLADKINILIQKTPEERMEMGEIGAKKARDLVIDSERIVSIYKKLLQK